MIKEYIHWSVLHPFRSFDKPVILLFRKGFRHDAISANYFIFRFRQESSICSCRLVDGRFAFRSMDVPPGSTGASGVEAGLVRQFSQVFVAVSLRLASPGCFLYLRILFHAQGIVPPVLCKGIRAVLYLLRHLLCLRRLWLAGKRSADVQRFGRYRSFVSVLLPVPLWYPDIPPGYPGPVPCFTSFDRLSGLSFCFPTAAASVIITKGSSGH